MNEVIEAFRSLIPPRHKKTGRGFVTFNCPACGDRRGRGGFLETSSGGFRYRCMNGGCRYESNTGWEPDNAFMGRPRRLFELMGGDTDDIPKQFLDGPSSRHILHYDMDDLEHRRAWIDQMTSEWSEEAASTKLYKPKSEDLEVAIDFPSIQLPKNTVFVLEGKTTDALDVQYYVINRCHYFPSVISKTPLLWCPKYKRHVIIPFIDKRKIIGWIARKIDDGKEYAHIKCPNFPSDYMLNQHLRYAYKTVIVVEGAFDALAMRALCTFGNVISKKQINLLNQLQQAGRRIALLPDFKKDEWKNYWHTAKEQGWYLCVPEWPGDDGYSPVDYIKDPGDSIKRNGLLYTIEVAMNSLTNDYGYAEQILLRRSR